MIWVIFRIAEWAVKTDHVVTSLTIAQNWASQGVSVSTSTWWIHVSVSWLVLDLPNNNSSSSKIMPPLVFHPSKLGLHSLPLMKLSFISVFLFCFVLFSFYFCVNASVHSTGPKSCIMGVWEDVHFGFSAFILWKNFPCSSAGKESVCNVGDLGLIPGLGRSPGERKGYSLQYFGLENSMEFQI